jgi:diguanylate cyclase (GGDEF)-like protein
MTKDAPTDELRELLEASFTKRSRRLPRRELAVETAITIAFLGIVALMSMYLPAGRGIDPLVPLVVIAYALASRVAFPLGAGNLVPTQPFLVALFALAPANIVPALVCAGLALGAFAEASARRTQFERLSFSGGDAFHSLGPALMIILFAHGDSRDASLLLIGGALAAQLIFDLVSSTVREWVASNVRPELQLRVIGHVCAVDVALTPLGVLAAGTAELRGWAPLALIPLVGLFAYTARDRLQGVERAHTRLEDLRRERHRLRLAVRRVGDAFASNLDLDALLRIVLHAGVEALDGDAGRASGVAGPGRPASRTTVDGGKATALLARAETFARQSERPVECSARGQVALACRIEAGDEIVGIVGVSRGSDHPFDDEERGLLAYLCAQAGVAATNVLRHEALHQQAVTDDLTGLANHRRLQEQLTEVVAQHGRTGAPASLVLMDLDDFKLINDTHGHYVGDRVLRAVAAVLRRECRMTDEPARYGGEELAVVMGDTPVEEAGLVAERIRVAIADEVFAGPGEKPLTVTVSVGVATLSDGVRTKAALIAAADGALYRAKAAGKNRISVATRGSEPFVNSSRRSDARAALEQDLHSALERGELFLEYQPIVRLDTGEVAGIEALVRWRHPERGVLPPSEFVPMAENRGLIVPLGEWVLESACREAVALLDTNPDLAVTVNVSLPQLAEDDFVAGVRDVLAATGLPAANLMLELTESVLMHDVESTIRRLEAVKALGVRVAVDDFGTGHSSLQYLLRLPLDVVKVPREFVDVIDGAEQEQVLARTIVEMAHRLGLEVVAEGIERGAQYRALALLGCSLGQGFLTGRPMAPSELRKALAQRASAKVEPAALKRPRSPLAAAAA